MNFIFQLQQQCKMSWRRVKIKINSLIEYTNSGTIYFISVQSEWLMREEEEENKSIIKYWKYEKPISER